MSERRDDIPRIHALALLGEQFELAIERVEAAEAAAELGRERRGGKRRERPTERRGEWRGFGSLLPRRRTARAALAAAFACIAALLVYALALESGPAPSPEEALAEVSEIARLQPMPADDEFTYTRASVVSRILPSASIGSGRENDAPGAPLLVTSDRRSWVSIGRPGLVIDRAVSIRPADPAETVDAERREQMLRSATLFEHPRLARYKFGSRSLTRAKIVRVPTDPRAIVDRLNAELSAQDPDARAAELWTAIEQTLTRATAPLPPELRAGLIDALALVPGVEVTEDEVETGGRTGREFTLNAGGIEQRLVFDVETAEVLRSQKTVATQRAARDFDQPVGSLLESYELIESAIAEEIPADALSEE